MLMLSTYLIFSIILALALLSLGWILLKKKVFDRDLQSPFECGFSTMSESRIPFSLRFFILALIFVIFDVEIIVMMPIILIFFSYLNIKMIIFYLMFLMILTLGLLNEWNQNMLEWIKFYKKL